jgi:hypothetical protein
MKQTKYKYYKSKYGQLSGSNLKEIRKKAHRIEDEWVVRSHRQTFIKSAYSNRRVFTDEFWNHLVNKSFRTDKIRRLRLYKCALDLIANSHFEPKITYDRGRERYEFYGLTANEEAFCVHIYKDKKNGHYFMSCFPEN